MRTQRFSRLIVLLPALLLLPGCARTPVSEESLESRLNNPLFAEWYYDELVESMVNLELKKDPVLEDQGKNSIVQETRSRAFQKAQEATRSQREGFSGFFTESEEFTKGEVLYKDDTLFFGEDFVTAPGPSLHLFLTTAVAPETHAFPDETAIDLGALQSPYGAQRYRAPPVENPEAFRTAVIFDRKLERIHGFAQLSPKK